MEPPERINFLDLPQEIRDLVYLKYRKHSHVNITGEPINLLQPNIAKVSRRLRNESLDVFYGKNTFMLDMRGWKHNNSDYPRTWTPFDILHEWIGAIGDSNAARMRRLFFYSHNFQVTFRINVENESRIQAKFRLTRPDNSLDRAEEAPRDYYFKTAAQRAEAHLSHVVQTMLAASSDRLTAADIIRLADTVDNIQPTICTRYGVGYKGALMSEDASQAPPTAEHRERCEECGYHRIVHQTD